ncbi:D-alanyl-D-alanine carboxypeptidase [Streptomyces sp. NPDC051987]|uniref:serine hydrolase n=1 Tax=Streptomyces sp. NPDC051987 TaxID=3155808 RepID=UPI00343A911B
MVRTAHGNVRSVEEASVAGESPDRSKQRESSAEPTSGSAGTVPEARDPRLAVAAEKETAGGVDTATRVFSVRDLNTADETGESGGSGDDDTQLRDAAATWVRTGEDAAEAVTEAEEGPETPADAADPQETPEQPAKPPAAPEATTDEPAATEPDTDPKPPTQAEEPAPEAAPEPADTKPKAAGEPEDAKPGSDPKTTPEPQDTAPEGESATTGASEEAGPKPPTQPEDAAPEEAPEPADTKPKAAAEPQDAEPTKTAPEPEDAKPTKTAGEPEDAKPTKPAAEPQDAKPGSDPKTTAEPQDTAPEGESATAAEPEDAKPANAAGEPQDAKPGSEPKTTPEPQDTAPEGESATAAEPEDAKPANAAGEPQDAKPGSEPKTTPEPQDTAPEGESATAAEPEDAKPAKEAGEPEDAKPRAAAQDAEPKAVGESAGRPKWAVGGGGADADGEKAPKGRPAPDNDGRTGGAGGKTDGGEGEAEAAVDQPTALLKAPRPPQVDQPTTTLKLGGAKPRTPEADAERTSRFVALKSDMKEGAKPEAASTTRTTVLPQVGPERTTQQPLPPKPPLDLLAELTNTPPPPETPVRTLFRRVKIWTPLVIVLLIVFAVVQTLRPLPQPTLDLTAKDTYTFDGGKVDIPWPADGQAALDVQGIGSFGSSGARKPVPIASVAKVMTAYIVLRDHPLKSGAAGPKIKIDQAAQDQANAGQESTVDVTAGDSITQREALESILIASANNVARLLARWDAGSEKAFVAKMNATAKQLGMTDTTYTDPSGLTNSTVSTAVDQVKLAKAAMASEPSFREVAAMMSYDDYKGVNHGNWNQLVGRNDVVGIKTGTTTSALGNLVFAAKKTVGGETRTIIGAVLRQPASAAPDNSILTAALNGGDKLIRAAQGALESATIYKKGALVGYVDDGLGGRTPVVATEDVTAVGWSGLKVRLSFQADHVPHTAKAGTKVGTLTVGDGSGSAVRVPVALREDLAEPGFASKLTRLG